MGRFMARACSRAAMIVILAQVMLMHSTTADIQADLEQIIALPSHQLPALTAAVAFESGATNVWVTGVRKWADATPATTADIWHLGSCTKAMTATLLAIQIEKGLLTWNSTISELFPEYADIILPEFADVPIGYFTAMRSGVSGDVIGFANGQVWAMMRDPSLDVTVGRQNVVKDVLSQPPATQPGSAYEYSNFNYIIAGAVIEKFTEQSWENAMTSELFVPLGMSSCVFGPAASPSIAPPNQPWPHQVINGQIRPITPNFNGDNPPTAGPAGSVSCSMEDWAKFAKLHMDGFNGIDTPVLQAASFQVLHQAYPGQEYTYGGWGRMNRPWANGTVLTHEGSNLLNFAVVWVAPSINISYMSAANIGGNNNDAGIATDQAICSLISNGTARCY